MKLEADRGIINFIFRRENGQVYFNTTSFKNTEKKEYNISYKVGDIHAEFDIFYDPENKKTSITKKGKVPCIDEMDLKVIELMIEYPLEKGLRDICKLIYEKYTMFDNPRMPLKKDLETLTKKEIRASFKNLKGKGPI